MELRWSQVDFVGGLLVLNPSGRVRTSKRRPAVPIGDDLLPVLQRAHREATTPFVLDHSGSIRTAWGTVVTRAGMPEITPHVLRHTWATQAARAGVPMHEIAAVLGDTLATVTRVYLHHSPDYLRGAVNFRRRG